MRSISSTEARALDKKAQEFYRIPSACLMEVAGSSVSQEVLRDKKLKRVCIFCGKGNNGGDGLVVARYLINAGIKVKVYLLAEPNSLKPDPKRNFEILKKMGAEVKEVGVLNDLDEDFINKADVVVDAIFGIGLTKEVGGLEKELIEYLNRLNKFVVAVDVPSGLNSDTGEIQGAGVKATQTLTFVAAKPGFFLKQGPKVCGKIIVKDIGIPQGNNLN